jgi:hypothetical protein
MKTAVASLVVAFLGMISLVSSALAGSTGTISSKGPFVDAAIYSVDSSGNTTEIYVDASTATDHQPGGPPAGSTFVFAEYVVFDTTGALIDYGYGYIDGSFTVAKKLTSGSVTASGTVYSAVDGSAHTVDLSLTLTPSGPSSTESYVEHFSIGPVKYVYKFSGTDQPAIASGDASLDGVDLGSFSQYWADLGTSKSSQLQIGG